MDKLEYLDIGSNESTITETQLKSFLQSALTAKTTQFSPTKTLCLNELEFDNATDADQSVLTGLADDCID
ncbi:hypothetical protein Trichorick_00756 [Candidatus Trichorickettsia mobilis]|uniref:Uncharacterized protein n=2 Tax=Candidatus Trichorickettsia mobilis TaxID=1346319 RepID=A0ABZ0UTN2_9RICK|nr:hypothetical protein Trichorick_00756 [Candidatus Trichorickettsia mobilis]